MSNTIRVVIADDHELVRRGLRMILAGAADIEMCGEATTGREAVALVAETAPDLLLLDARMPEMSGIDAAPLAEKVLYRIRPFVIDDSFRHIPDLVPLTSYDRFYTGLVDGRVVRDALEHLSESGHFSRLEALEVNLVV